MPRHFEHLLGVNGEILLADPNSQKGKWGLHHPEAYEPTDPQFLAPVLIDLGHETRDAYLLAPPCPPVCVTNRGVEIGADFVAVEERQPSGWFSECLVHISRIIGG